MTSLERQQTEEASSDIDRLRREIRSSLSQILAISPLPMVASTIETGRFIDANAPFLSLVNLRQGELLGQTPSQLGVISPEELRRLLQLTGTQGRVQRLRVVVTPRNGAATTVEVSSTIFDNTEQPCLLWIFETEQLGQDGASKDSHLESNNGLGLAEPQLETIGRLAGAIAHTFGNLLLPIIGLSEMGLLETSPDNPLHGDLEQIRDAASQANELARQLLAFGSKQQLKLRVLSINNVVKSSEALIRRLIREDIAIDIRLHPALGEVRGDPSQLQQVLINLVLNARDAMPHGGSMTIETSNIVVDEDQLQSSASSVPGRFVMLSITDTGYGMDAATQSRVFEPFFTTKGQGLGMGLATTYGIVKQHGGTIWVFSKPGEGATLKVCLPRLASQVDTTERSPTPLPSSGPQGSETILVVEDEDIVRRMVCRILKTHGYAVLAAPGGAEALELMAKHPEPIALLLTDVIMPRMNGKQLREEVRRLFPKTKALYMSGYADTVIARHGVLDDDDGFLQKPFSLWDLTKKVREALDR